MTLGITTYDQVLV